MSRIGKKIIVYPKEVKIEVKDNRIYVEGPKGKLDIALSPRITLEIKDNQVLVKRATDIKTDKSLHGLFRALIVNMVKGVTEGYKKELEIIGVGFKAAVQGNSLNLNLGFSHPVTVDVPEGLEAKIAENNVLEISGVDKQGVGQFAADVRKLKPVEPYKGKGFRYVGEHVRRKAGKKAAAK